MAKKKNFHSDMGSTFFSDAVTVVFGNGRFVLDFKKTAPRIDQVGDDQNQTLVTEHNPVLLQPKAVKMMMKILENNVERYEDKFGEIELPDFEQKEETMEEPSEAKAENHTYIG